MTLRLVGLAGIAIAASSCAGGPRTVDFASVDVSPPTLLIGEQVERELILVIDPARVPDDITVKNSNGMALGTGVQSFITNGITKVLSPYFAKITSVGVDYTPPPAHHLVADVELQGVSFQDQVVGGLRYRFLRMQWSFAVRPSETKGYVFSYAGEGLSTGTYRTPEEGADQMLTNALNAFQEKWNEADVYDKLRALEGAGAPNSEPSTKPTGI